MIYFDNAATGGFKARTVADAVAAVLGSLNANPTRSGHRLALAAGDAVLRTRELLRDTFGAERADRVVFTANCTAALNTALLGTLNEGDEVVATCMEHNSVLRPLNALSHSRGVRCRVAIPQKAAYISQKTLIRYRDIAPLLTKKTRLVVTAHACNVTGNETDIEDVGRNLKRFRPDIIYLVDGAQSGGHISINMADAGVDILCLAGHKGLGGIMGTGVLMFGDVDIRPLVYGGTGTQSSDPEQPAFYPERLESGTLPLPSIVALYEGVLDAAETMRRTPNALSELTAALVDALRGIDGVAVYSPPNRCGIAAFQVAGAGSDEVADILSEEYNIAVRGGLHCAPLMHRYLGTETAGLVRASLSVHNTVREISVFAAAVREIAGRFRK